ncbi:MAG: prepilin-type N-terminal cleavage/methylation domain-containing protein [bacterium]|nr:prepilin-type N-terminal cleavage/methylation domain-containing protein [bacterium]
MKRTFPPIPRRQDAFTIVELIVAMAIISILTLILVPALNTRSKEAKISAAEADLQALTDAEERAAIQTNYMFRVYALNDTRGGDGTTPAALVNDNNGTIRDEIDGIRDNSITGNNMYQNPMWLFINPSTQDFAPDQTTIFDRLTAGTNVDKAGGEGEKLFNWNGPYVNWKRDNNRNDWPDDPWGNDYLLFTRRGVIYPPNRVYQNGSWNVDTDISYEFQMTGPQVTVATTGGGTTTKSFPAQGIFDRPTFLSLGPNGLPGNGTDDADDGYGRGDDLIRSFGGGQ